MLSFWLSLLLALSCVGGSFSFSAKRHFARECRTQPTQKGLRGRPVGTSPFPLGHQRTLLRVAHTPNVRNEEMDDQWLASSNTNMSQEMDSYDLEWSSILDPLPHDETVSANNYSTPLTANDWQVLVTCCTGLVLGFWGLLQFSGPGAWRYYWAGGVCAAVSHTIPVPIDVVKTRKQVDPDYCNLSMPAALTRLVRNQGIGSLFTGLGPTFWGYFVEGAVKFGVYEILKPWFGIVFPNRWLSFCACAAFSGFAAGVMLCPMEALRIRLVAEAEYAEQGWIRGGLRMIQREGTSGLTRGLTPMLYKQIPYTITKNVSFDFFTKYMYAHTTMKVGIPLVAAAVSSVLSCLSSQPGDMLLSLVNAHEGERRGTRDLISQIYHSHRGLRGFMVGLKTRLLHVGVIVTVQLLIYDFVKRLFGIAATGSV